MRYPLVILITLCPFISCGQTKSEQLHKLMEQYHACSQFSGSVLVAEKGKVIYREGFGWSDQEKQFNNDPETKFRLASISKMFTSMLVMQLVAEGKLDLNTPISTYLPDYTKANADRITLHHLMTHTSGIPNYTSFPGYRNMMGKAHTPAELVKLFEDAELEFTPGAEFRYSNSGYVLLGYIVEKVTGNTYAAELDKRIYQKIGMTNSGYELPDASADKRAKGYNRIGTRLKDAAYLHMSVPFSAGALYSTVDDMFKWDRALYTNELLPERYREMLFQTHIPANGQHYGYGWEIGKLPIGDTEENVPFVGHSGAINGFMTQFIRIPSDDACIILLSNAMDPTLDEMLVAINGVLHDKPYQAPEKTLTMTLADVLEKEGVTAATAYVKELQAAGKFKPNEGELNTLGYEFMQDHKESEAAYIFSLNVEAFPKSFNVYDSYGEALLALGQTDKGLENYKKSVELNPGNENGMRILRDAGIETSQYITRLTDEQLQEFAGSYHVINEPGNNRTWQIDFRVENGVLHANDRGYQFRLIPVSENRFVNPDDGASLVFETSDEGGMMLTLFEKVRFRRGE